MQEHGPDRERERLSPSEAVTPPLSPSDRRTDVLATAHVDGTADLTIGPLPTDRAE